MTAAPTLVDIGRPLDARSRALRHRIVTVLVLALLACIGVTPTTARAASPAGAITSWVDSFAREHGTPVSGSALDEFVSGVRQRILDLGVTPPRADTSLIVYTGVVDDIPAWKLAEALANTGPYHFISSTPAGAAISDEKLRKAISAAVGNDIDLVERIYGWSGSRLAPDLGLALDDAVSERLVSNARGRVIPLLPGWASDPKTNGVFFRTELPALLRNPHVTHIGSIPMSTLRELGSNVDEIARIVGHESSRFVAELDIVTAKGADDAVEVIRAGPRGQVPSGGGTLRPGHVVIGLPDDAAVVKWLGNNNPQAPKFLQASPAAQYESRVVAKAFTEAAAAPKGNQSPTVRTVVSRYLPVANAAGNALGVVSTVYLAGQMATAFGDSIDLFHQGRVDEARAMMQHNMRTFGFGFGLSMGIGGAFAMLTGAGWLVLGFEAGVLGVGLAVMWFADGIMGGVIGQRAAAIHALSEEAGGAVQPAPRDPIVLDMADDGFAPTGLADGTHFDLDANGFAEKINWVQDDDVILARDLNGNGIIDNGLEVFGDHTRLVDGTRATSGFEALSELDSDGDGAITPADDAWDELLIWDDRTNPGRTDPGELSSLEDHGITAIELEGEDLNELTEAGVLIGRVTNVSLSDGRVIEAAEYWVQSRLHDTIELGIGDEDALAGLDDVPNIPAIGNIPSLHRAIAADGSGTVRGLVEEFDATTDVDERNAAVERLLLTVTGGDQVAPNSRGGNVNAQHLAAIEKVIGEPWVGRNGTNPNAPAGQLLNAAWGQLMEVYYSELLYRMHLLPAVPLLNGYLVREDGSLDTDHISAVVLDMGSEHPDQLRLVQDVARYLKYLHGGGVHGFSSYRETVGKVSPALDQAITGAAGIAVFGTEGPDRLSTTATRTVLYGNGGDDVLSGGATNDMLVGGDGDDHLAGGAGTDTYVLSTGNDTIADTGNDSIVTMPPGLAPQDVTVTRTGNHLLLTHPEGSVTFQNWYVYAETNKNYPLAYKGTFQFDDGTTWD
ncbi:hypothetical protein G6556_09115, partial [Cellulomonas sp. IC4_254]|nr:hypothetical protein [Cellulomonas sp. IC4_254]